MTERVPIALLILTENLFLIYNEGYDLEPMKERANLLLPVIKGIYPARDGQANTDAVKLGGARHDKRVVSYFVDVESVGQRPGDIMMKLEKIVIKVGMGGTLKRNWRDLSLSEMKYKRET